MQQQAKVLRTLADLISGREFFGRKGAETFLRESVESATLPPLPGLVVALPGDVRLDLCYVPPGVLEIKDSDGAIRKARVAGFFSSRTPITQGQYAAVMGANPSHFKGEQRPVETVSWNDAWAFCAKLNEHTGIGFRLPTELEWEWACRAGTTTEYHAGDGEEALKKCGWYHANSEGQTHDVGKLLPNAFGLHDCHGNVWEWCRDEWSDRVKVEEVKAEAKVIEGVDRTIRGGSACSVSVRFASADYRRPTYDSQANRTVGFRLAASLPPQPESDAIRVLRGGCWYNDARDCRSAGRNWYEPGRRYDDFGFRLAVSISEEQP